MRADKGTLTALDTVLFLPDWNSVSDSSSLIVGDVVSHGTIFKFSFTESGNR